METKTNLNPQFLGAVANVLHEYGKQPTMNRSLAALQSRLNCSPQMAKAAVKQGQSSADDVERVAGVRPGDASSR